MRDARANGCQPGPERGSVDHYFFNVPRIPFAVALLAILAMRCSAANSNPALLETKDQIVERGDWTFHQILLGENTRSQVVIGKLKFKGKEVTGEPNQVLATSFGPMVFYSYPANVHVTFGPCGWTPVEKISDKMVEAELDREFSYWTTKPKKK